jgi:hypothetical protein
MTEEALSHAHFPRSTPRLNPIMHTHRHQPLPLPGDVLTPSQRHRSLKGRPIHRRETRLEQLERVRVAILRECASLESARNLLLGRHKGQFIGTPYFQTLERRMEFQWTRYKRVVAVLDASRGLARSQR